MLLFGAIGHLIELLIFIWKKATHDTKSLAKILSEIILGPSELCDLLFGPLILLEHVFCSVKDVQN